MRKASQRQLVNEAFADVMRGIGAALKQTKIGQAVAADLAPITNFRKAFKSQQPDAVLKEKLKTDYFRTFDYKSVKLGKATKLPGDAKKDNRVAIPFTAMLIKKVSKDQSTGNITGGKSPEDTFTAVLSRDKKSLDGSYQLEIIKDATGKVVEQDQGSRKSPSSKITKKVWADILADVAKLQTFTVDEVLKVIALSTGYTVKDLRDYDNKRLANAVGQDVTGGKRDLQGTTQYLTTQQLLEKNKQTQLQLIESSYNLLHELSINKGN
jgi:hypothetical protein